jgi:hypothetical protein
MYNEANEFCDMNAAFTHSLKQSNSDMIKYNRLFLFLFHYSLSSSPAASSPIHR